MKLLTIQDTMAQGPTRSNPHRCEFHHRVQKPTNGEGGSGISKGIAPLQIVI
jgi:hypothetical protein